MNLKPIILLGLLIIPLANIFADEKQPDLRDYTPPATRSIVINGQLDGSDLTFNRRIPGFTYSPNCSALSSPSGNVPSYYEAYTFTANSTQMFEAYLTSPTCTCITDDPVMFLYCFPFDPLHPDLNLRFSDDDDGTGCCSAIVPADNVSIIQGEQYVLVVSSYSPLSPMTYELNIQSNVSLVGVPISGWAIAIGIGLILVVAFLRFRRLN